MNVAEKFVIDMMKKYPEHNFYFHREGHFCMEVKRGEKLQFNAPEGAYAKKLDEKYTMVYLKKNSVVSILLEIVVL